MQRVTVSGKWGGNLIDQQFSMPEAAGSTASSDGVVALEAMMAEQQASTTATGARGGYVGRHRAETLTVRERLARGYDRVAEVVRRRRRVATVLGAAALTLAGSVFGMSRLAEPTKAVAATSHAAHPDSPPVPPTGESESPAVMSATAYDSLYEQGLTDADSDDSTCEPRYYAYESGKNARGGDNHQFGPSPSSKEKTSKSWLLERFDKKMDACGGDPAFAGAAVAYMHSGKIDKKTVNEANRLAALYTTDTTAWEKAANAMAGKVKSWSIQTIHAPYNTMTQADGADPSVRPDIQWTHKSDMGTVLIATLTDGSRRYFRTECDLQPSMITGTTVPQKRLPYTPHKHPTQTTHEVPPVHPIVPVVHVPKTPVTPNHPVTPPVKPPVVTPPEKPPVVTPPEKPPVVTPPEKPPVVTPPEKPPVVTPPEKPPVVTPPVVTPPEKPAAPEKGKDATKQPPADAYGKVEYGNTGGNGKGTGTVTGRDGQEKPIEAVKATRDTAVAEREKATAQPDAGHKTSGAPGEVIGVSKPVAANEVKTTWTVPAPTKPVNQSPNSTAKPTPVAGEVNHDNGTAVAAPDGSRVETQNPAEL